MSREISWTCIGQTGNARSRHHPRRRQLWLEEHGTSLDSTTAVKLLSVRLWAYDSRCRSGTAESRGGRAVTPIAPLSPKRATASGSDQHRPEAGSAPEM